MRFKLDLSATASPAKTGNGFPVILFLELLRHPDGSTVPDRQNCVENLGYRRNAFHQRQVDGLDLRPVWECIVGDYECIGMANPAEKGQKLRVEQAIIEHAGMLGYGKKSFKTLDFRRFDVRRLS